MESQEIVPIKSKRGRKKKWESSPIKNYTIQPCESVVFSELDKNTDIVKNPTNENEDNLKFGNLTIKVKGKEKTNFNITDFFNKNKKSNCLLDISDEEDETDFKMPCTKVLVHSSKNAILGKNGTRCYYCHHPFDNLPFYIPLKYSEDLDRYKLFGNFCSPNCAKSYCLSNKLLENKLYLLCQFYKKLFGPSFKFTPAPSFLMLKEYGGTLTIEEFRNSRYVNDTYTLNNLVCEIIHLNR